MKTRGIYIHIPFCLQKCNYCDFLSFVPYGKELMDEYLISLKKEIQLYSYKYGKRGYTSIYFGGGTPTVINSEKLVNLLQFIKQKFLFTDTPEITIEANPGTLNYRECRILKEGGFTRVSLGIQSLADELLVKMGRIHNSREAERCIIYLKEAGFKNINVDLIYGLPGQTIDDWKKTLEQIVAWDIPHIATYGLKIEEGTRWGELYSRGKLTLPSEDETYCMYEETQNYLSAKGYINYEISNWAKAGYQSKHNKVYWMNNEYLGFGVGSAALIKNCRLSNVDSIIKYIGMINEGRFPVKECKKLTREERMSETMILGLRLKEGVDKRLFKKTFGCLPEDVYGQEIKKLVMLGLLEIKNDRIALTPKGFPLANLAMQEFV